MKGYIIYSVHPKEPRRQQVFRTLSVVFCESRENALRIVAKNEFQDEVKLYVGRDTYAVGEPIRLTSSAVELSKIQGIELTPVRELSPFDPDDFDGEDG